jgi:3-hydroxybutyryl-CoA dehydratase
VSLHLPYDDLEPGTRFTGRGRTVTEADVVQFAALTGDMHPQHTDAEWAARSRFGRRIAHGLLVVSYAVGLLGFDPELVVALRGVDDVVFKRPVPLGSTIRVEGVVEEGRPLDDEHGLVPLRLRVLCDGRLAVSALVQVLWRRDTPVYVPAPAAHEPIPL